MPMHVATSLPTIDVGLLTGSQCISGPKLLVPVYEDPLRHHVGSLRGRGEGPHLLSCESGRAPSVSGRAGMRAVVTPVAR
jgi:hypothetical protein